MDDPVTSKKEISPLQQYTTEDITKNITENEPEGDVEVENIERPVDLYKVTPNFSFFPTILLKINTSS